MPQPMSRPTASAENPAPTAPMGLAATPPAVAPVVGVEVEANSDSEYETDPDAEPEVRSCPPVERSGRGC